jgi:hypothetical protein
VVGWPALQPASDRGFEGGGDGRTPGTTPWLISRLLSSYCGYAHCLSQAAYRLPIDSSVRTSSDPHTISAENRLYKASKASLNKKGTGRLALWPLARPASELGSAPSAARGTPPGTPTPPPNPRPP